MTLFWLLACFDDSESTASLSMEERQEELRQREESLGERFKAYEVRKKSKEATIEESATENEPSSDSKTVFDKAMDTKDAVVKTAQKVKEVTETTLLVVDAIELSMDKEEHQLLEDFSKAHLEIVEIGNHLECQVTSTDGEFAVLKPQDYEIAWWYRGVKVTQKASRYCSGATLGIGLNSGPNCPHHIKGAFYPYMAPLGERTDRDTFQCGLSFSPSFMRLVHKQVIDESSAELKSAETTWSRWSELKLQKGGPWQFKGTEVDCGKDGPQGYRCFDDGLSGW